MPRREPMAFAPARSSQAISIPRSWTNGLLLPLRKPANQCFGRKMWPSVPGWLLPCRIGQLWRNWSYARVKAMEKVGNWQVSGQNALGTVDADLGFGVSGYTP